ncbi:hypothetical protein E0Z10_g6157 [Xylaria hypoxylon]|uniref:Uncharacterized protein n=1 Tax=Xylaria hypoxylon TaxID=37992 RepID=A0A4Z0YTY6_9PEZI|nr:hypothetical protein E0Z10_g6157 [Xylaria hypoxylon]
MSLLHRWSLPTRGFARDRSKDGESSDQFKFPTIHIGQLGPRQRANLSSVFSTLFEKPEDRRSIRNADCSEAADDLRLLASRRENVPPDTDFKPSHTHEHRDITPVNSTPSRENSTLELVSKYFEAGNTEPSSCLMPGIFGQVSQQIGETPNVRSFSLSSTEARETENLDKPSPFKPADRISSASSCYPSEGMRSPVSGHCSPEPVTARTMNYFTEYRCFGQYPSQSSWRLSNMDINEASSNNTFRGKTQATLAGSDTASDYAVASQNYNFESYPFTNPPEECTGPTCSHSTQVRRRSTIIHAIGPQQKPSSTSEITVPILENKDSISSQLEVSFIGYKQTNARSTSGDDNDCQLEGRNTSSADRLRPSADTDRTMLAAVRRSSRSDEEDGWSTIREIGERPLSRPASWLQLFTLTTRNSSSNNLAQRLQKLKLRRWAKRVCFKTKARFELVGRPVSTAKPTSPKVRRRNWRRNMKRNTGKRVKKVGKGLGKNKKNKSKKHWSLGMTIEVTKKRVMQHKETADHFFGTLTKRKSLQFGPFRSEKEDKFLSTHKRMRSCPAEIGL